MPRKARKTTKPATGKPMRAKRGGVVIEWCAFVAADGSCGLVAGHRGRHKIKPIGVDADVKPVSAQPVAEPDTDHSTPSDARAQAEPIVCRRVPDHDQSPVEHDGVICAASKHAMSAEAAVEALGDALSSCRRELDPADVDGRPRHNGVRCHGWHTPEKRASVPNPLPEITEARQKAFLECFSQCGSIRRTCLLTNIPRETFYGWRDNAEFAKRFDAARETYADLIDEEMHERGIVGWEEPVIGRVGEDQDGVITYVRKKSDQVLLQLARGNRPEKYNKTRTELTGKDGAPLIDPTKLSEEQLKVLLAIVESGAVEARS